MMNVLAVSGYGWTGSGAVVDLLREVECCASFGSEFSLIKEPRGLIDLECFLVERWDVIRHDRAIKDFLSYCEILARPNRRFGHWGGDLNKSLDIDLSYLSRRYINSLTGFTYRGSSRIHNYDHGHGISLLRKIGRVMGLEVAKSELMRFARPRHEDFILATRSYLEAIFAPLMTSTRSTHLILDQAIPTANPFKAMMYFSNLKLLLVDRDPRDIYVDQVRNRSLIGANVRDDLRVEKFINWYSGMRIGQDAMLKKAGDQVLKIQFENLISNYEVESRRIIDFCGLEGFPRAEKKFFAPAVSEKNVGLWRRFENRRDIVELQASLKDIVD